MRKPVVSYRRQQENVNAYFHSQSSYWKDIYTSGSVQAEIFRARQATVLAWINELALAPGSRVLEIGCGAGFMAVALAQRGLHVYAIDSTEAMIEQARRYAAESGATELLSLDIGDVYTLTFEDGSFDLVIAIGVIPWLARPELAMREIARVIRPDGRVILTADNRARLTYLLDPWMNPVLSPLRRSVKSMLERVGFLHRSSEVMMETLHSPRFIDNALASAELVKIRDMTLGFGPFSFLQYKFIPEPLGTWLHRWLQRLADRKVPLVRTTGAQYLVLAQKARSHLLRKNERQESNSSPMPQM
jgi:ubiquinone/menaquinone biosynthesis C-methylase UbiE